MIFSNSDLEKIFEQWPDPVIVLSENGTILATSPAARVYDPRLSLSSGELNIRSIATLDEETFKELVSNRENNGISNISLRFGNLRSTGDNIKMQCWRWHMPTCESGDIYVFRALGHMNLLQKYGMLGDAVEKLNAEIKRRREIEIRLRFALEEAKIAMHSKDQFIRQISHEFRTPLNAVIGMSEIMMRGIFGKLEGNYEGYAKDINYCGRTILELIDEILNYKEGERYTDSTTDMNECLDNCLNIVSSLAVNKGLTLNVDNNQKLPTIKTDQVLIKRIMVNLITNAIKYTPSGGTVNVTPAISESGGLYITVSDDGIGIKEKDLAHIFEPFYRAEDVYVKNADGLGMGLALTKRAIEQLGGTIDITSTFGKGTTVLVYFPATIMTEKQVA